jgi:hypothetical protein
VGFAPEQCTPLSESASAIARLKRPMLAFKRPSNSENSGEDLGFLVGADLVHSMSLLAGLKLLKP